MFVYFSYICYQPTIIYTLPLLVADSGFLGQLCFICQLVHHCVNASLLLYTLRYTLCLLFLYTLPFMHALASMPWIGPVPPRGRRALSEHWAADQAKISWAAKQALRRFHI
jgi:hypothetical protein